MTPNNVIPLFTAKSFKSFADLLKGLNLQHRHPETGLKYEAFFPLYCLFFSPEFVEKLCPGRRLLYLYMTFLLWKRPIAPGCIRAALPFLAKGTGISRGSVATYIKDLCDLGLIECLEVNHNKGNRYRVVDILLWKFEKTLEKDPKGAGSGVQSPKICTTVSQDLDDSNPKNRPVSSKNCTKDYTSIDSFTLSLSQHDGFKNRWDRIPENRVTREKKVICSLLRSFPGDLQEIFEALLEIEESGSDYIGEPCQSPIGLLESSWSSIKKLRASRKIQPTQVSNLQNFIEETREQRTAFERRISQFLDSLSSEELHQIYSEIEAEIKKQRPHIEEVRKDSFIFRSFLESTVASKLEITVPETL